MYIIEPFELFTSLKFEAFWANFVPSRGKPDSAGPAFTGAALSTTQLLHSLCTELYCGQSCCLTLADKNNIKTHSDKVTYTR